MSRLSDDPEKRARSLANLEKGRVPRSERGQDDPPVSRETPPKKGAKVGSYDPPPKSKGKPKRAAKKAAPRKTTKPADPPASSPGAGDAPRKRRGLGGFIDGFREGISG